MEKEIATENNKIGVTTAKRNTRTLDLEEGLRNWSNKIKAHQKKTIIPIPVLAAETADESN